MLSCCLKSQKSNSESMSNFIPVTPLLPKFFLHGASNESFYLTRKLESRAGAAVDEKNTKPLTVLE